jgi:hypothetical protein
LAAFWVGMAHPRAGFAARPVTPQGGNAVGAAEPDPRRSGWEWPTLAPGLLRDPSPLKGATLLDRQSRIRGVLGGNGPPSRRVCCAARHPLKGQRWRTGGAGLAAFWVGMAHLCAGFAARPVTPSRGNAGGLAEPDWRRSGWGWPTSAPGLLRDPSPLKGATLLERQSRIRGVLGGNGPPSRRVCCAARHPLKGQRWRTSGAGLAAFWVGMAHLCAGFAARPVSPSRGQRWRTGGAGSAAFWVGCRARGRCIVVVCNDRCGV